MAGLWIESRWRARCDFAGMISGQTPQGCGLELKAVGDVIRARTSTHAHQLHVESPGGSGAFAPKFTAGQPVPDDGEAVHERKACTLQT